MTLATNGVLSTGSARKPTNINSNPAKTAITSPLIELKSDWSRSPTWLPVRMYFSACIVSPLCLKRGRLVRADTSINKFAIVQHRPGQHGQIFLVGHINRAEMGDVRRAHLRIEHAVIPRAQPLRQRHQRDLRAEADAREHGLAEECRLQRN